MQHIRSQFSKRILRAILTIAAVGLLSVSAAHAAISTGGNVSPTTDPFTWTSSTKVYVGNTADGSLTLNNGSSLLSSYLYLGYTTGVTGTASIDGISSKWASNTVYVGYNGNGMLSITNGGYNGKSSSPSCYVGYNSGSTGRVNIDGSGSKWGTWQLHIGSGGTGTLSITNGGTVSSYQAFIGYKTGSNGTVAVNGSGSQWISSTSLTVGNDAVPASSYKGTGKLSISNGGAVTASAVSINSFSALTTDVGSQLTVGGGTGTLTNNGTIRLVAGASAANGTYTPMSYGTMSGTGTVQALGGMWDATNHSVTVSSAATGAAGSALTADLASTQRFLLTDGASGKSVGAAFQAATSPTNLTLTVSAISGSELTSLQSLLGTGQTVLSGWDFTTEGYSAGNPVYLSLFAGSGQSLSNLNIWHYDGSAWSKYDASDLAYDNNFASFSVTGLSGYAVSGAAPVPIPAPFLLLGSGLAGLGFSRRRKSRA